MEKNVKDEIRLVLASEEELLDGMLSEQSAIYACVKERRWEGLEDHVFRMEAYGSGFLSLDARREVLCADKSVLSDKEISDLVCAVRSKLVKSKVENDALSTYVRTTQEFVTGVIESCVPQRRNTLYTRFGTVQKPAVQSVVLNTLL